MNFSMIAPMALTALLFTASAGAQMTLPRSMRPAAPPTTAPAAAEAPAAQATQAAAAPDANAEKEAAGKLAAAGWLVLLDRGDWGRAWETSSSVFRTAVPLSAWMDGIPKAREPLGTVVERAPAQTAYKTTLEGRPPGEYVTVIFSTKFSKKEAEETVTTVRDTDGKWRVTGYSTR
jgi:hypothetical protein